MSVTDSEGKTYVVLGQKYAYATVSLVLGIACFVNLAGLEKGLLAVIFATLALRSSPPPKLKDRRLWAKTGLALGAVEIILIPTIILLNFDRLRAVVEALSKLSNGK